MAEHLTRNEKVVGSIPTISSIPMMLYVILIMVVLGSGLHSIILAMGLTYWVGMVRIVGLQTRYFLPVWLLLVLAAAAVLRRVLAPRLTAAKGEALAVTLCGWYAFAGAVLLFQHYFVGPVYTIYK